MSFESFDRVQGAETDPEFEEFKEEVEKGIEHALSLVRERFEAAVEVESNLDYHNEDHSKGVVERVEKILKLIQEDFPELVTEKDVLLGRYSGSWHDVVQEYSKKEVVDDPTTEELEAKLIRQRHVRANESSSADEAVQYAESVNEVKGKDIFSEDDFKIIREAIDVTVPSYDVELKTVFQANLKEDSPLAVRALALADLGTAGIDGGVAFAKEGAALFREENLDIQEALRNVSEGKGTITKPEEDAFRARILGWLNSQESFAMGRKALLDKELGNLPDQAKERLKEKVFNRFDESILAARQFAEEAKILPLDQLVDRLGYEV